mmetsp:Transcript_24355/g.78647  ORF Transcript_24355/g.78647 Transcript_24355/m.78647 type:complete len:203 (-) Transcript_24355:149-757(-)
MLQAALRAARTGGGPGGAGEGVAGEGPGASQGCAGTDCGGRAGGLGLVDAAPCRRLVQRRGRCSSGGTPDRARRRFGRRRGGGRGRGGGVRHEVRRGSACGPRRRRLRGAERGQRLAVDGRRMCNGHSRGGPRDDARAQGGARRCGQTETSTAKSWLVRAGLSHGCSSRLSGVCHSYAALHTCFVGPEFVACLAVCFQGCTY